MADTMDELIAENARLREALEKAAEWLEGWASAEPYLSEIRAALSHPAMPQRG